GWKEFGKNEAEKERFEAALAALDLLEKVAKHLPDDVPPQMLALLLVGLQPPPQPNQAPGEAGVPFLLALKAVKDSDYAKALPLLDKARKMHDERRFLLPNKPQNPTSDPNESIFLFACDELKK